MTSAIRLVSRSNEPFPLTGALPHPQDHTRGSSRRARRLLRRGRLITIVSHATVTFSSSRSATR